MGVCRPRWRPRSWCRWPCQSPRQPSALTLCRRNWAFLRRAREGNQAAVVGANFAQPGSTRAGAARRCRGASAHCGHDRSVSGQRSPRGGNPDALPIAQPVRRSTQGRLRSARPGVDRTTEGEGAVVTLAPARRAGGLFGVGPARRQMDRRRHAGRNHRYQPPPRAWGAGMERPFGARRDHRHRRNARDDTSPDCPGPGQSVPAGTLPSQRSTR